MIWSCGCYQLAAFIQDFFGLDCKVRQRNVKKYSSGCGVTFCMGIRYTPAFGLTYRRLSDSHLVAEFTD